MTQPSNAVGDAQRRRRVVAEARKLLAIAEFAGAHGDYDRVATSGRQALALAESGGLRQVEAQALGMLAAAEARLGDGEGAILHGYRALALLRRSDDSGARVHNLCNLVVAYLCVGLPADALACATAAMTAARVTGEPSLMSWALNRAGSTHRALGEPERSVVLLEEALRIARQSGLEEEEASACNNLCGALLGVATTQEGAQRRETLARALRAGAQGLARTERSPNAYGTTMCHGVLAGAHLAAGNFETSLAHALHSRTLAQRHGYRLAALTARIICATLERERGQVDASIALYNELLDETRGTDDCDWVVAVHQGLHQSHTLRNEPAQALEHLEALRHFSRQLQEQRAQRHVRILMNKVVDEQALARSAASSPSSPAGRNAVVCEFEIVGLEAIDQRHGAGATTQAIRDLQAWLSNHARATDRVLRADGAGLLVIQLDTSPVAARPAHERLVALAARHDGVGARLVPRAQGCRILTPEEAATTLAAAGP